MSIVSYVLSCHHEHTHVRSPGSVRNSLCGDSERIENEDVQKKHEQHEAPSGKWTHATTWVKLLAYTQNIIAFDMLGCGFRLPSSFSFSSSLLLVPVHSKGESRNSTRLKGSVYRHSECRRCAVPCAGHMARCKCWSTCTT